MAIFIGINSWAKCPYTVTYMGGVWYSSDNTWPIFVLWLPERLIFRRSPIKAYPNVGRKEIA
jgi:hypothetical protein